MDILTFIWHMYFYHVNRALDIPMKLERWAIDIACPYLLKNLPSAPTPNNSDPHNAPIEYWLSNQTQEMGQWYCMPIPLEKPHICSNTRQLRFTQCLKELSKTRIHGFWCRNGTQNPWKWLEAGKQTKRDCNHTKRQQNCVDSIVGSINWPGPLEEYFACQPFFQSAGDG